MYKFVTIAIAIGFGISDTIAKAISSEWQFPSCNTVSFRTTGATEGHNDQAKLKRFCENLTSTHAPTILELINSSRESGCSYKVTAFSGPNCRDDRETDSWTFDLKNPVIALNEKAPICSYRVKYNPWPNVVVRVEESNGDVHSVTHHHSSDRKERCVNWCSGDKTTYYPRAIGVFNDGGQEVDHEENYIELFSQPDCPPDAMLSYRGGRTHVTYETNLDRLTRNSNQTKILSYRIESVKK